MSVEWRHERLTKRTRRLDMQVARIVRTGVWDALPAAEGGWTIFTTRRPLIRVHLRVRLRGGGKKSPHWHVIGTSCYGLGWASLEEHVEYHCERGRWAA